MEPWLALTREVSSRLAECELTHRSREPIDVDRARQQHLAYEGALAALGCRVERIDPLDDHPDGVFVEDAAVVLDHQAVLTRSGAESRRGELDTVAAGLAPYRELVGLESPAQLDGGDVLRLGEKLFVGLSSRTNEAAVAALSRLAAEEEITVTGVAVRGCLHLKTAVTALDPGCVLLNPRYVDAAEFGVDHIAVDPDEPDAANVLAIEGRVIVPSAHPRTAERIARRGFEIHDVDVSELAKAEAGVTCCSLVFQVRNGMER